MISKPSINTDSSINRISTKYSKKNFSECKKTKIPSKRKIAKRTEGRRRRGRKQSSKNKNSACYLRMVYSWMTRMMMTCTACSYQGRLTTYSWERQHRIHGTGNNSSRRKSTWGVLSRKASLMTTCISSKIDRSQLPTSLAHQSLTSVSHVRCAWKGVQCLHLVFRWCKATQVQWATSWNCSHKWPRSYWRQVFGASFHTPAWSVRSPCAWCVPSHINLDTQHTHSVRCCPNRACKRCARRVHPWNNYWPIYQRRGFATQLIQKSANF